MTITARGLKQPFNIVQHTMFDTHKYVKLLKSKGLKETQAESIVQVVSESREFDLSRLATKEQVENLEKRFDRLEQEVKEMRKEMRWVIGLILGVLTLMAAMFFKH